MTRRGLQGLSWLLGGLLAGGCGADRSLLTDVPPPKAPAAVSSGPSVPASGQNPSATIVQVGMPAGPQGQPAAEVRAQKPEGVTPVSCKPASQKWRLLELPLEASGEVASARQKAVIVATVNGEPILNEEVTSVAFQELGHAQTNTEHARVYMETLKRLIDREVVLQDALTKLEHGGPEGKKFLQKLQDAANKEFEHQWLRRMMTANKMNNEADFAEFLQQHGLSLAMVRRQWVRDFLFMEYVHSRIDSYVARLGHRQVAEYYEKHPEEFQAPDSVDWQDLFIDSGLHPRREEARELAVSLAERIRQGEDITRLKEFDNGESCRRNGQGQGHKHGEIQPPQIEATLFKMKDGQVEVVEMTHGYHVVRLVKRQYAGPLEFDSKVQKQIFDKLRTEVFKREAERLVHDLCEKAIIDKVSAPPR